MAVSLPVSGCATRWSASIKLAILAPCVRSVTNLLYSISKPKADKLATRLAQLSLCKTIQNHFAYNLVSCYGNMGHSHSRDSRTPNSAGDQSGVVSYFVEANRRSWHHLGISSEVLRLITFEFVGAVRLIAFFPKLICGSFPNQEHLNMAELIRHQHDKYI